MLNNKRGVSEVIVTVLILLLIIAAVAILWVVIGGFVRSSTERISLGVNAINLEIVQNSLKYKPSGDLEFKVKRNTGGGNMSSVKVLIEDESGQQVSYNYEQPISELETRNVLVPAASIASLGVISKVSIAPIVKGDSGKEYPGDVIDDANPGKGFVSSEGLVLYMPFDEDAKDKSGNGNDGVLFGDTKLDSGKIGQAYKFDGNGDYINISNIKGFSTQQVSVVAWVYPTAYNTATGFNHIINKGPSPGYLLYGPMTGGGTYFNVNGIGTSAQILNLNNFCFNC